MTLVFEAKPFFSLNKANDSENVLNNYCACKVQTERFYYALGLSEFDENMPGVHVNYSLAQPKMGGEKDIIATYGCLTTSFTRAAEDSQTQQGDVSKSPSSQSNNHINSHCTQMTWSMKAAMVGSCYQHYS